MNLEKLPEFPQEGYFQQLVELQHEKEQIYGSHLLGGDSLGKMWAGILSNHYETKLPPLPAHIVHLMMVGLKICRAAINGPAVGDNYDDAIVYMAMAMQATDPTRKEIIGDNSTKRQ